MAAVGSPRRSMTSIVLSSWLDMISLLLSGSEAQSPSTTPLVYLCGAGRSSEACVVLAGTMKACLRGEGFQVRSSSGPLSPVCEVHGVFSNRNVV